VFCVQCEPRLEKQLRTALFFVIMQRVVIISYQHFGTADPILTSGVLTPKNGTGR
jgi:hypothetical protein